MTEGTKNLGSILDGVLQQKSWQFRLMLHQVFLFWDKLVGDEISSHAQPYVIKGDVLWVNVTDSVWMQHLQFEKGPLLQKINRRLQKNTGAAKVSENEKKFIKLSDIRFNLDTVLAEKTEYKNEETGNKSFEIDQERLARFENAISASVDPEIQESMKRIWLAVEARRNLADD